MSISFPRESPEYRAARNQLLAQEIDLRRAMEAVAILRRALPPGGLVFEMLYAPTDSGQDPRHAGTLEP